MAIRRQADAMTSPSQRRELFISYSHADREWVDRLQKMIQPLVRDNDLKLWDDSQIPAGARWKEEIQQALATAKIALLLVSSDFLASDFVNSAELPHILKAAEEEGMRILWVKLRPCLVQHTPIHEFQAAIDPVRPLTAMAAWEQEEALAKVAETINVVFQEARKAEREWQEAERLAREEEERQRRRGEHEQKLQRYEQAFAQAINTHYPLDKVVAERFQQLQRELELGNEDVAQTEAPLIASKQAEYQRKNAEERERQAALLRQQDAEATERQKQQQAAARAQAEAERQAREQKEHQRQEVERAAQAEAKRARAEAERQAREERERQRQQGRRLAGGFDYSKVRLSRRQLLIASATAVPVLAIGVARIASKPGGANAPTPTPTPTLQGIDATRGLLLRQGDSWQIQKQPIQVKGYDEHLAEGVALRLIQIPAGTFLMGSPPDEPERSNDEGPQHEVTLGAFFLGQTPITQAQWRVVAGWQKAERGLEPDPSRFKGANRPVEQVSWIDAMEFCRRLSLRTGRAYTLPSEAQWEYGCRAGTTTPFHFGATITPELANYNGNYTFGDGPKGTNREQTTDVGSFPANDWGLQDMHGNVWDWCLDHWHDSYKGAPGDGSAWLIPAAGPGESRLLRGGSWYYGPRSCRSAYRLSYHPGLREYSIGFRVCCLPPGSSS